MHVKICFEDPRHDYIIDSDLSAEVLWSLYKDSSQVTDSNEPWVGDNLQVCTHVEVEGVRYPKEVKS